MKNNEFKNEVRNFLKSYGDDLRVARKQAELNQKQLAKLVPCSQAIISHIENGYMLPPPPYRKEVKRNVYS